jgi:type IV secretory pathway TrbL component
MVNVLIIRLVGLVGGWLFALISVAAIAVRSPLVRCLVLALAIAVGSPLLLCLGQRSTLFGIFYLTY